MGLFDKRSREKTPAELYIDMRVTDEQIPQDVKDFLAGQIWFAFYPNRVSKYVVDMFTPHIWNPENKPTLIKLSTEVKEALTQGKNELALIYKPKMWQRVNVSWYHEDCGTALIRVMADAGLNSSSRGVFPALLIPDFLGQDIPGYTVEIWPVFHPKPEPWNKMDYFKYGRLPDPALPVLGGYEKGITNMLKSFNQGLFIPARIVVENSVIRYYAPSDIVEKCGWNLDKSTEKNILAYDELIPTKFS